MRLARLPDLNESPEVKLNRFFNPDGRLMGFCILFPNGRVGGIYTAGRRGQ
jgi:hypothetical protein